MFVTRIFDATGDGTGLYRRSVEQVQYRLLARNQVPRQETVVIPLDFGATAYLVVTAVR